MGGDDDLIGQVLSGRYRIERLIQRGGMGAVYEAVQEPLGRRVAIKVLHPHLASDEVTVERFRREAEATAKLNHPHIVQVTDYQARPGEPAYLVMEYLTGRSLAEVMREDGILPGERAVHIAVQILDALGAAHGEGIVHRDLKPTNVLLGSSAGLRDVVTILDFGIAKLIEVRTGDAPGKRSRLTMEGALVGTPAYMSPEQARGDEIDARADLYALGVLMYAMLAGRLPYGSRDPSEILRSILDGTPAPLAELRPDLDADLVDVVERALAKDPSARFQTAEDMRRALQRWQRRAGVDAEGAVVTEGTPEPPSPAPAASPRGRIPPAVLVVGGLIFAAGLGAAIMYLVRPAEERRVVVSSSGPVAGGAPADANDRVAPVVVPVVERDTDPDAGAPERSPRRPTDVERAHAGTAPRDAGPSIRLMASAPPRMYYSDLLARQVAPLSATAAACTSGQDVPPGSAPPVWHLDVAPDGTVRAVRTTIGEWPVPAANCVTRALTGLALGPTLDGDGGQIVVTVGPR